MRSTHIPETAEGFVRTWKEVTHFLVHLGDHRGGNISGQKENDQVKGTHKVVIAEGGTCQDRERKRLSEGYSPIGQLYATETDKAGLCT